MTMIQASACPDRDPLGNPLTNDGGMRSPATQHGLRTTATPALTRFVADHGLSASPDLINLIDPPPCEALDAMITTLETDLTGPGASSPLPATPVPSN